MGALRLVSLRARRVCPAIIIPIRRHLTAPRIGAVRPQITAKHGKILESSSMPGPRCAATPPISISPGATAISPSCWIPARYLYFLISTYAGDVPNKGWRWRGCDGRIATPRWAKSKWYRRRWNEPGLGGRPPASPPGRLAPRRCRCVLGTVHPLELHFRQYVFLLNRAIDPTGSRKAFTSVSTATWRIHGVVPAREDPREHRQRPLLSAGPRPR